jgi:hypothetical protein
MYLAQNGSGFNASTLKNVMRADGSVNWGRVSINPSSQSAQFRIDTVNRIRGTNLQYDTQFMLLLYINDLRELNRRGWDLPFGLTLEDLGRVEDDFVYGRTWE